MNHNWIVIFLALALTGCPKAKMETHRGGSVVRIKGDPMAFVAGRTLHPESTIATAAIDLSATYQVYLNQIQSEIKPSFEIPELAQAPEKAGGKAVAGSQVFYTFQKTPEGSFKLGPFDGSGTEYFFDEIDGHLVVSGIAENGRKWTPNRTNLRILSYSSTPDGKRSSVLMYWRAAKGEVLTTLYINQLPEAKVNLSKSDSSFNFLFGRGVKVAWPQLEPLKILYCGPHSPEYLFEDFMKMTAEWQYVLQNRLTLAIEKSVTPCPPFSDVNTRTFGFVDAWIEDPDLNSGTLGMTIGLPNLGNSEFIDADIFVLSQEITDLYRAQNLEFNFYGSKSFPRDYKALFSRVALHEMGHLLGLHHVFDGTLSVMSYQQIHGIMAYDREAIQHLYPLMRPTN